MRPLLLDLTLSNALQYNVNTEDMANKIKKLHEHVRKGI